MFVQGKGRGLRNSGLNEIPVSKIKDIIKEARNVSFPWDSVPAPMKPWLQAMGGAINTQPEFLLVGALTVTSCLIGPDCVFRVRERHLEPCNLFTLCLCEPGTGKTQAYKVAVESPLKSIATQVLIHEYTAKGLFDHLQSRGGRALLCHAEMLSFYETLMKRQSEGSGERQFFCRLHDGDTNIIRTIHATKTPSGSSKPGGRNGTTVLDKTCMAVGGFCQPQPFMYLYHMLGMLDDGFSDRVSMCMVKSVILKENEIEQWNIQLDSFNIAQFDEIYAEIYDAHQIPKTYIFDEEASAVYVEFSDNIVQEMNKQLEDDIILSDNLSKDRKIFIRLSAVIHVLFTVMEFFLEKNNDTHEELVIPERVTKDTAIVAKAFVQYFASQRKAMNKIKNSYSSSTSASDSYPSINKEVTCGEPDIFEIISGLLVKSCKVSSPEMIRRFVRTTKIQHQEALAIRWEELPKLPKDQDETASSISKDEVFTQLSKQGPKMCSLSQKRAMKQPDGSTKDERCIIIYKTAFTEVQYSSLEKVIPSNADLSVDHGVEEPSIVLPDESDESTAPSPAGPGANNNRANKRTKMGLANRLNDALSKHEVVQGKRQCR